MRSLQDEIRQAQATLVCPICQRRFLLSEIRLRTFEQTMSGELSVVCNSNHYPIILIVPVDLERIFSGGSITNDELLAAHRKLEQIETLSEIIKKD